MLWENGINGILADEMGLGKTIQCIAHVAMMLERKVLGPYFVVAPQSTLPNWINEFKRFTPEVKKKTHTKTRRPKKKNYSKYYRSCAIECHVHHQSITV